MEFVLKGFIFSAFIAVIATADNHNQDIATKVRTQLQDAHTCLETLSVPLTTILFASNSTYVQMCGKRTDGKTFFTDCERQFFDGCTSRGCDSVNLMPWVQGFPKVGIDYICNMGLNALIDIQNNGGKDCMANVGFDIAAPILTLYGNVWNGQNLSCSDAGKYMQDVSNKLNSCDKKELRNVVVKYFDEVVNITPCKGDISPGAATSVSTNLLLCVVAIVASLFIAFKKL